MCPKKKFDKLQSAEAAYRNFDNSKPTETAHWKFNNLQSAEAAYRRATAKTSDGAAKTSEHRREQDAEMKKEKRNAPLFGADVRDSSSSFRMPFSFRMPSDSCDIAEVRGSDLYDEFHRRRNDDRYDDRRSCRFGNGVRFDEQKRTRDGYSDMSSRDRHSWWSPSRDDYWTPSSRRGCRYDEYDPYDSLYGTCKQRKDTFGKEEKAKNDRESRLDEKKPAEMKQKKSADSKEFGTIHERENDVRRRAMKLLDEVSGRKKNSRPAEEGLKAAVEEAARKSNGRDTNCRCFVTKLGRSQIRSQTCPSCKEKVRRERCGQSTSQYPYMRGMSDEAVPAADEEQIEKKKEESEPVAKADVKPDVFEPKCKHDSYDHCCSTDSSSDSDSDFEALSYESIPDEIEKEKYTSAIATAPPVEQGTTAPAVEQETAPAAVPEAVPNPAPVGTLYPALSVEARPIEPARVGEDQSIANRLIEMGFSAEEVFRVVRMHGCNFERCIEEILPKEH
ncbi:hypothetical protein ANCCAN_13703 [Ancylostoma caninum]|uniref:UBA domain-containing protein n=1 Tax=Ancylostoma caninum TaxID=29170 RepID=A0A368G7D5_ANCCA|nr:hypothetical protein ANCCAN_13703 [Ancylostoma caninum]